MQKVLEALTAPERVEGYALAEDIARVVYEAATDDEDRVTYVAGKDAIELSGQRQQAGPEGFRKVLRRRS